MHEIRTKIKDDLGYTCSAGIAPNKMVSFLSSPLSSSSLSSHLRDQSN